ncbi:hypothetical protein QTP88_010602 [Uroleucon formosanum]
MWLSNLFTKTKDNEREEDSINKDKVNEENINISSKHEEGPVINELKNRVEKVKKIHTKLQELQNEQDLNLNNNTTNTLPDKGKQCASTNKNENNLEINKYKIEDILRIISVIENDLQSLTDKVSCLFSLFEAKQFNAKIVTEQNIISNNFNKNTASNSINKLNGLEDKTIQTNKDTSPDLVTKEYKKMRKNKRSVIIKKKYSYQNVKIRTSSTEINNKDNQKDQVMNKENVPGFDVKSIHQLTNFNGQLESFFTKIQLALTQCKIDQVREKSEIMFNLSRLEDKINMNDTKMDKLMSDFEQLSKINDPFNHVVLKKPFNLEIKNEQEKSIDDLKICFDYLIKPNPIDIIQTRQSVTTDNTNTTSTQIINSHDTKNQIKNSDIILCEFLKGKLTLERIKRDEHQQIGQVNQFSNQIDANKNSNSSLSSKQSNLISNICDGNQIDNQKSSQLIVCSKNSNYLNDERRQENPKTNQLTVCPKKSVHQFLKFGIGNLTTSNKQNTKKSVCEKNKICDFLSSQPIPEWIRLHENIVKSANVYKDVAKSPNCTLNVTLQLGVDYFSPTIGWLTRWKNRSNIVFKKTFGEKKDANFQAAEDYLNNFIASSNYAPDEAEITVYDFNEKSQIPGPDPVKWNLNLDSINFLLANPPKIDISTIPFAETKRMFGNISRRLTPDHFMRKLQNGEKKLREWILYSPSKNALFCFQCLLFSPKPTVFGNKNEGFINWKKCNESLQEHETSKTHAESVRIWFSRIKKEDRGVIDLELKLNIENQISYWKNVLYRVVETVSFLASRGLAFRGNSHNFGSKQNGNYLGCLELVAKFDPFLSAHIANYGNKGKGNVSYLSSNICDEFISLMSDTVIDKIVSEIKERKYFSLIVDSTPDVTTRDQLTVAIRYISNEGLLVERFLGFIPSVGHKGSDMEQALLKKFCELNIDLKFCRGQSYDNASNMSGVYNGLQTRIKNYSSTAFFVPCSAHSLNLIGSNAADTTQEGTKFFFICQAIYNFFSVSTFRWNILTNIIEKNPGCVKIKKLCSTRWSSRYDVCRAMCNGYAQVLSALNTICDDEGQKKDTRHEARSIKNKIESLNFCFMICMWTPILQRFNATSISLQSIDIDLATVVTLYDSLEKYVEDFRERFDVYLEQAKTMCSKQLFSWDGVRQKKRNKFFDETESNEELLGGEQKMKCEVFYVIIDKLAMNLRERKLSYTDINNNFGFILKLDTLDTNGIRESAKNLVKIYPEDLNETFIEELVQFKNILNLFSKEDKSSFISLLKCLTNSSLLTTFPNVEIVLRIFCCMASSNASGERSFSVLKRIKNYLRSALVDEKMSSLSILNIESDILQQIDLSDIIHKFAVLKSRKKLI